MMLFSVKDFRQLIVYKKVLSLLQILLEEELRDRELSQVRLMSTKISGYIAQSQVCALYPNESSKHFGYAIKWTNVLEKKLKNLIYLMIREKYVKVKLFKLEKY